ncbi:MAG: diacylglycerol/lipid kinase family protein [Candidatus Thorarchaeota archaeon]
MVSDSSPSDAGTQGCETENSKKKEVFLVINPVAAGGRVETIWKDELKPLMDRADLDYAFEFTESPLQAIDIARTRVNEGYRVVCSVGGDGTANEVINGILQAERPGIFAALPVGTGDDVPITFGIPEEDLEAAVECLVNGQDKTFDLGYCENADRYFAGVASMGFDAEVADRTNRGSKRFGTRSYQIALGLTLAKFRPYNLAIQIDGEHMIEGGRMLLAIGNGKRYGGGMHICPDADVTDGRFALTTVKKISRITLLRFFSLVYDGTHLSHKSVDTFEGKSIHVDSSNKKCLYQVDGETLGYLPETFITKPNHITVRVPSPWVSYAEIWEEKLKKKQGYGEPYTGYQLQLAKLAFFNPSSNYKRGLEWSQNDEYKVGKELVEDEIESDDDKTYLYVKEKPFSKRLPFFLLRTFFQTFGLSIAFTAPITFPWFFDIVFPDLLSLIPPEFTAFINNLIRTIQSLFIPIFDTLSWLEPLIRFFMDLGAILNPFLVFSLLMIFFNWIGSLPDEEYQDPFTSTNGTPTSTGYFLESIQRKFSFDFSSAIFVLLIVSSFVSFFLVIRRARGILYEVMTTKEEIKYMEKVRKVFLYYCKDGNYNDIKYTKDRLTESRRTYAFANLVKYGPLVSMIIPALLAIFYILL